MKFLSVVLALIFMFFFNVFDTREPLSYGKFTKVYCNYSGKSIKDVMCKIKPISRSESWLNIQFTTVVAEKVLFFHGIFYKRSGNVNYIKINEKKDLDLCKLLDQIISFPLWKPFVEGIDRLMPGIVQKCPLPMKQYSYPNMSLNVFKKVPFLGFGSILPNGIYKFYMRLYDHNDDNVYQMTLFFEIKNHFGVSDF